MKDVVKDNYKLMFGDCLERMKEIPDGSVDLVLTDPPYGTTACKWDSVISFDLMWEELKRIIKPNGAIVLFGSEPFSSKLRCSNLEMFKYDWIWEKSKGSNFTHAKNMPIKFHETISVFSKGKTIHKSQSANRMPYNPQGLIKVDKKWSRPKKYNTEHKLSRESHKLERVIEFENYPKSILKFTNSDNRERGLHPTQKPVALLEYLTKTYTQEGEIVLDFTMGSGSTGVACLNTNRKFLGIEMDANYYEISCGRLNNNQTIK